MGRGARGARSSDLCVFLCGDVMTGRGVDQILPHPGSLVLYEPYVRDARDYVRLAQCANVVKQKRVNRGDVSRVT